MQRVTQKQGRVGRQHANQSAAPFESLETRTMMAAHVLPAVTITPRSYPFLNQTIHVTNTHPSGAGSLADAINNANISPYLNVTIDFQLPANSVIHMGASYALPTITRSSLTIDGTTATNVTVDGTGGGILGLYIQGSHDTFKGLEVDHFSTGFAVYSGSNNVFDLDKTNFCDTGIGLYLQSNNNTVTRSVIYASKSDGVYVGGQNNQIGALGVNVAGFPDSNIINNVSGGNGIEVANSNNVVRSNYVLGASNAAILISKGSGSVLQYNPLLATGTPHGSAIQVAVGANGNTIGGVNAGNTIHYFDVGATSGSYALNVRSTGNTVSYNETFLNGSNTPSYTSKDIFIAAGNSSPDVYG